MGKNIMGFVGVGQAGANVIRELKAKGFENLAVINSSSYDLKSSGIEISKQLHLGDMEGCGKDRKIAKDIMQNEYKKAVEFIKNTFSDKDIKVVYFIFSAGGGTGSGMTPVLIKILEKMGFEKDIGAVAIYPSMKEDVQAMLNTSEAMAELYSLDIPVINIDNSKIDKIHQLEHINKKIAKLFSDFLDEKHSEYGTIDLQEKKKILTTPGSLILAEINDVKIDEIESKIQNEIENGYFIKPQDTIVNTSAIMVGLADKSLMKNVDTTTLENMIGEPVKHFKSIYFAKQNECLAIYNGLSYPSDRIEKIKIKIEEFKNKYKRAENNISNDVKSDMFEQKRQRKEVDFGIKLDLEANEKINVNDLF